MYSVEDLYSKLKEIETLMRENTNHDGTMTFDPYRVMVSLELTRRMIAREEKSDLTVDGQTET